MQYQLSLIHIYLQLRRCSPRVSLSPKVSLNPKRSRSRNLSFVIIVGQHWRLEQYFVNSVGLDVYKRQHIDHPLKSAVFDRISLACTFEYVIPDIIGFQDFFLKIVDDLEVIVDLL